MRDAIDMALDEALDLALEALEFIPESGSMLGTYAEGKRVKAITAIKQARSAPVQEPVFELQESGWEIICDLDWIQTLPFGTKLYTTPPAAFVQETVAWVLLREDEDGFEPIQFYGGKEKPETAAGELKPRFTLRPVCFADTTPPAAQRQWVGLTDEEREQHRDDWRSNIHDKEFRAIEAKLKEKNT